VLVADRRRGRTSLALVVGTTDPVALVLAPTASLAGRVVDAESGKPLAGVRLVARAEGAAAFQSRSGADGRYAIRGLPPRRYRLSAESERFVPWSRSVTVAAGQEEAQDVPLTLGATLAGRVVDEEGRPIEGALVQVTRGGENVFRAFVRAMEGEDAARTDRDGSFRATRLAPGDNQRLDVRHDEHEERAVAGLSLVAGATRSGVTVVLRRGLSVRGVVKDEEGRPLAGAEVTLSRPLTLRAGRGGRQMTFLGPGAQPRRETGADGRFEFRGLKAGDYTVSARRAGFARATVDPVKVAEGRTTEPVALTLRPGSTISGFVRDKTGGASGWSLSAQAAGQEGRMPFGPGSLRSEEPTGPDGAFLLEGLVAGESYDLQVMGPSGLGPRKAGVVAPAEGVELTVTGAGQVLGRVADADSGRPVPDFQIRYLPDAQGGMRFVMRAGPGGRGRGPYERQPFHAEDGSFALEDVPAGRWTVEAFAPGYQSGSASGVTVGEGETVEGVEVRLSRGGVIGGKVLESRTGRPILDATVRTELSGGGPSGPMIRLGGEGGENEASTDAEGRYEIAGLAPGTWTITASHPDGQRRPASSSRKRQRGMSWLGFRPISSARRQRPVAPQRSRRRGLGPPAPASPEAASSPRSPTTGGASASTD
jgi:protocatechuate 3,4-dioxygenase beta subunit